MNKEQQYNHTVSNWLNSALGVRFAATKTHAFDEYSCHIVTEVGDLAAHLDALESLQHRALEDNYYLTPSALQATMRHFGSYCPYYVVFVYATRPDDRRLVGCAVFALMPPLLRTMAAPVLSLFIAPHFYLARPILDRVLAAGALAALWDWIELRSQPWKLVHLRHMSPDSPTWAAIRDELRKRGRSYWTKDGFSRAALRRHDSFEAYLSSLSASRRKSFRRDSRRLERLGNVRVVVHRSAENPRGLARRFMELEAASWKGVAKSALMHSDANRSFFEELTHGAAAENRLLFVELLLDDRPIAMTANFTAGSTMFAFKVAYHPDYADYSPGILAEIETVRAFHATPGLAIADGGTIGKCYLDSLWRESRALLEIYSHTGAQTSSWRFRAMVGLTLMKRTAGAFVACVKRGVDSR